MLAYKLINYSIWIFSFQTISNSNSNVIMKRINFIQRPTPAARGPRATRKNSTKRMWWLVVTVVCTLWFLRLILLGVCWKFLCPLQSLCPALSSGVNHNATARMAALHIYFPCRQPDLGVQYHPWSKVDIRGQPHLPHSMGSEQGWGHLRANPGFGVFWFIPPLLSKPIFGQPPL